MEYFQVEDEIVQSEVLGMLSVLELVDLQTVATRLMLEVTSQEEGNKLLLLRTILRYLNSEEVENSPDGGMGIFMDLHDSITRFLNPEIPTKRSFYTPVSTKSKNPFRNETFWEAEQNRTQNYSQIPLDWSTPQQKVSHTNLIDFDTDLDSPEQENKKVSLKDSIKNLRIRDFKISGAIGSPGQKDKLSFSSLVYQINTGLEQGYSTSDILSAVIKAINPGNALRSYLEGRGGITIKQLLKILRSHFKEKNATSLFTELATASQNENESAQEFIIRAMSL